MLDADQKNEVSKAEELLPTDFNAPQTPWYAQIESSRCELEQKSFYPWYHKSSLGNDLPTKAKEQDMRISAHPSAKILSELKELLAQCRFEPLPDQSIRLMIPKDRDFYQFAEEANQLCVKLQIEPAVDLVLMEEWRFISKKPWCGAEPGNSYCVKIEPQLRDVTFDGQAISLEYSGKKHAPAGAILLAAVSYHLHNLGTHDLLAGLELRTEDERVSVKRTYRGLICSYFNRRRFNVDSDCGVACASIYKTTS